MIVQRAPSRPSRSCPSRPARSRRALRQRARHDQAALLRFLRRPRARGEASDVQSLWIDDAIAAARAPRADRAPAAARRRAQRSQPDRTLHIEPAALAAAAAAAPARERDRDRRAGSCGRRARPGAARVVAVLDTGLVTGFPQLSTASGAWFDPYDQHKTPFDEDARAHGTEVADVVVSMAPDVRILAARVFSDGGRSTTSAVHRVFEWALDPDGNPRTDDAPSVVNGSWDDGGAGRCETEFDGDLAALRAAGIVPVFAAGNAGPGREHGREPRLRARRGRGRQRLERRRRVRRSRDAGRRRAPTPSSRRSRPTARRSRSRRRAGRRSSRAPRSRRRRSQAPSRC